MWWVRGQLAALVIVAAGHRIAAVEHVERAGHAEMHQQHLARRQIREQIFGAAAEPADGVAFDALDEILRQRPTQVAAPRLDFSEARTFHDRRQAAADGFDLG